MNKLDSIKLVTALLYATTLCLASFSVQADHLPPDSIVMFSSGQTGSGVYEATAKLADLYSQEAKSAAHIHAHGHALGLVVSAAGSCSNLKNLISSHNEFGVVRADVAEAIYRTPRAFGFDLQIDHARVIGELAPAHVQVVARKTATPNRSIASLAGSRIGIGLPDQQVKLTVKALFESHGLSWDSLLPYRGPLEDTLRMLRQGQLDVLVWIDQLPSPQVDGLLEDGEFELLSLQPQALQDYLDNRNNAQIYQKMTLTVAGQQEPVLLLAVDMLLMARDTVSPSVIEPLATYLREQFRDEVDVERTHPIESTIPMHEAVGQFTVHTEKSAVNQLEQ